MTLILSSLTRLLVCAYSQSMMDSSCGKFLLILCLVIVPSIPFFSFYIWWRFSRVIFKEHQWARHGLPFGQWFTSPEYHLGGIGLYYAREALNCSRLSIVAWASSVPQVWLVGFDPHLGLGNTQMVQVPCLFTSNQESFWQHFILLLKVVPLTPSVRISSTACYSWSIDFIYLFIFIGDVTGTSHLGASTMSSWTPSNLPRALVFGAASIESNESWF